MNEHKSAELLFYKYVGSVVKTQTGYMFDCRHNNKRIWACFPQKIYGSLENARIAAESYQEEYSDKHDLTTMIFAADTKEELRRYLIGFGEGDGCIGIDKRGYVNVSVTQAQNSGVPKVLSLFRTVYGGHISGPYKRKGKNVRQQYTWNCTGFSVLPILKDWIQFGVLKQNQAKLVFDFMINNDTSNCKPLWAQLHATKEPENYREVEIDNSILTIPYLAGLFDAEGCITCSRKTDIHIFITQENSPKLLNSLNQIFCQNLSTVDYRRLYFRGSSIDQCLCEMLPYLVGKAPQALVALQIRKYTLKFGKRHSNEARIELEKLRNQLSALKKI
jgi:hypothetical protein